MCVCEFLRGCIGDSLEDFFASEHLLRVVIYAAIIRGFFFKKRDALKKIIYISISI